LPLKIKINTTMQLTRDVLRNAFLDQLKERNLKVQFEKNNYYILTNSDDRNRIVAVKLIYQGMFNKEGYGSHNGNIVNGIGHFKFLFPKWQDKYDFFVFTFLNTKDRVIEFVIVPNEELRSRFLNQNRIFIGGKKSELTLWLMQDSCCYDTTNLSVEGEWYTLSKGSGGRMADGTEMDYTRWLNYWEDLKNCFITAKNNE